MFVNTGISKQTGASVLYHKETQYEYIFIILGVMKQGKSTALSDCNFCNGRGAADWAPDNWAPCRLGAWTIGRRTIAGFF